MYVIKRNQIIVTALVVMIAVAGYLSLSDQKTRGNADPVAIVEESDITGVLVSNLDYADSDVNIVEGEVGIAMEDENESEPALSPESAVDEPGAAVFVNTSGSSSYFVQAKLDREQVRSKQTETLKEMINNKNIEKEQKAECANSILELQKRIEMESSAEAMIEAKGFNEAYVRMDDTTVDVVVSKEALSEAEIAQIEDIVKRKTGLDAGKIRISPLKKN